MFCLKGKGALSIVAAAATCLLQPAFADQDFMKLGISEYKAGDFANASGHLGAALSTDYNNPTLHYYLANSYVKLGQKDGAIREFRIAYALQPKGEIAQYSKQALIKLGAAVAGADSKVTESKPVEVKASQRPVSSVSDSSSLDRAMSALKEQSDREALLRSSSGQSMADSISKHGSDLVKQTHDNLINDIPQRYSRRYGTPYSTSLSPDAQGKLDSMKKFYDAEKSKALESSEQSAKEIQKSSENLQNLLNDKPKSGGSQLVPTGTNLYIRNYKPVGQ